MCQNLRRVLTVTVGHRRRSLRRVLTVLRRVPRAHGELVVSGSAPLVNIYQQKMKEKREISKGVAAQGKQTVNLLL